MLPTQETLKEILLRDQLITPEDLNRAIEEQERSGGELSRILLRLKLVAEDQLSVVLSEALQLPLINLNLFRIDPSLLKLIPKETAEKSLLIPISRLNDQLTIAMVDPLDMLTIDNIKAMTSMSVSVVLARPKEMRAAIERSYAQNNSSDLEEIFQDIKDTKEAESLELVKEHAQPNKRAIENLSEEAPIITLDKYDHPAGGGGQGQRCVHRAYGKLPAHPLSRRRFYPGDRPHVQEPAFSSDLPHQGHFKPGYCRTPSSAGREVSGS